MEVYSVNFTQTIKKSNNWIFSASQRISRNNILQARKKTELNFLKPTEFTSAWSMISLVTLLLCASDQNSLSTFSAMSPSLSSMARTRINSSNFSRCLLPASCFEAWKMEIGGVLNEGIERRIQLLVYWLPLKGLWPNFFYFITLSRMVVWSHILQ